MSEIFIASSSIDEPTYGPVVNKLEDRGHDVSVYLADRVSTGLDLFSLSFASRGETVFTYNHEIINLEDIGAAWYRQPNLINLGDDDRAKQLSVEHEIKALQDAIWQMIPSKAWLNSPESLDRSEIKLGQLATAGALGFNVPPTVVSNIWGPINSELSDDIIVKMSRGVLFEDNQTKMVFTTRLSAQDREALDEKSPFPGIFQNYKDKSKEWRITVVGDQIFEVAIYTSEEAKDDWRKHQLTKKVDFKIEKIDSDIREKCIQFLGEYGLRYGAFDFVEDSEGKITFLECNPCDQYMWLENTLDLPISDAIVDELIKIAVT